jgi:hypothetical protein
MHLTFFCVLILLKVDLDINVLSFSFKMPHLDSNTFPYRLIFNIVILSQSVLTIARYDGFKIQTLIVIVQQKP